ncbi:hypothetical protein Btru_071027 [Bulinus truncatus]|nr:hypothetical protein Btru_071027 [Bulinus truncatus]
MTWHYWVCLMLTLTCSETCLLTIFHTVNVTEGAAGSAVNDVVTVSPTNISCTDPDNDTLEYTFYNDTGGDLVNLFILNPNTGELEMGATVDAEKDIFTDTHYIGVHLCEFVQTQACFLTAASLSKHILFSDCSKFVQTQACFLTAACSKFVQTQACFLTAACSKFVQTQACFLTAASLFKHKPVF